MKSVTDMLIRIKNAQTAGHPAVQIPYSQFLHEIARVLERHGIVGAVERRGKRIRKTLEIALHSAEEPRVHDVRFFSRAGKRLYASYKELRPARAGGVVILSTPKGVLSGEEARKEKVGGELIAEVW